MTVRTVTGLVDCEFVQYYKGVKYPVSKAKLANSCQLVSDRTAYLSGGFTPGRYLVQPYSISREEATSGPGQLLVVRTSGTGPNVIVNVHTMSWTNHAGIAGGMLAALGSMSVPTNQIRDLALTRAYAKVGSAACAQGENLGELRETLETLRHPLKELRKFFLGGPPSFRKLLSGGKVSSGTWLEFRYGFRPIYNSIMDIAQELQRQKRRIQLNHIYSVGVTASRDVTSPLTPFEMGSIWNVAPLSGFRVIMQGKATIKAHASVQYLFTVRPGAGERWGLALQYIPETAWALLSRSFLVDWFLAVGPWIASWRLRPGISILGDTVGVKISREVSSANLEYVDNSTPKAIGLDAKVRTETFSRTVSNGIPTLPSFRWFEGLSTNQTVDLLAIAYQSFSKLIK